MRKSLRYAGLLVAVALTIAAVATTPAAAAPADNQSAGWICEDGCWAWDAQNGCTQPVTCCANDDGRWFCLEWGNY